MQKRLEERDAEVSRLREEQRKRDSAADRQKQQELERAGEFQKLYEQTSSELKPLQQEVQSLRTALQESNEARVARLPAHARDMFPEEYSPEQQARWLDKNFDKLVRNVPQLDAGAGTTAANGASTMSPEERATAAELGISPEAWVKARRSNTAR